MTHNKLITFILLALVVLFAGCESNHPPNVQVGSNQTVNVGDRVRLFGSASDPDGAVETYLIRNACYMTIVNPFCHIGKVSEYKLRKAQILPKHIC